MDCNQLDVHLGHLVNMEAYINICRAFQFIVYFQLFTRDATFKKPYFHRRPLDSAKLLDSMNYWIASEFLDLLYY